MSRGTVINLVRAGTIPAPKGPNDAHSSMTERRSTVRLRAQATPAGVSQGWQTFTGEMIERSENANGRRSA